MTLAQARRQVWRRRVLGGLILALAVIALLFALVKNLYLTLPDGRIPAVVYLRRLIDQLLLTSGLFARLWEVIPSWTPSTPWNFLYTLWTTMVVALVGLALLYSARGRQAQIRLTRDEIEREGWRREALGYGERPRAPQTRGLDQYPAPAEPWYKRPLGIIALGVVVALVSAVIKSLLGLR
jgi:hypothetical protein